MARPKRLNLADEQRLKAALTQFRCCSYADIAQAAGWSHCKATQALVVHRKAAARDPQGVGWTIAPLPKGRRRAPDGSLEAYHFVVVDARTGEALTEHDRQSLVRGGVQTLGAVDAQMTNFAAAIRLAAAQLRGSEREQLSDIADILVGAGKMTTGAHRRLSGHLVAG
jgi:hypothetical protein